MRPFILRRTKDQVAKELPAKTEQTIWETFIALMPTRLRITSLRSRFCIDIPSKLRIPSIVRSVESVTYLFSIPWWN